ncbi:hypothetical protein J4217_00100 [Candidatus Pacearchaeota archaeon]|nr:hypothetical protein [Candidatus Pacearchaeota archaeon]
MHENSLYPRIYTEHVGRPLYKFSRRYLGKSKFFALNIADLPASIVAGGVGAVIADFPVGAGLCFAFHQFCIPIAMFALRAINVNERKSLDSFAERSVTDNFSIK